MISVIVPVYCSSEEKREFLIEALASVKAQSLKDFELVIIDDNSPLDINRIVEDISKSVRTVYIRNEVNMRQAASRNLGIKASKGDIIAFLDHDDIWLENKLEEQFKLISREPETGMVFCKLGMKVMPGSTSEILKISQENIPYNSDFLTLFKKGNYVISASGVMLKKQAMEEIGLFDERYTSMDDFDAWLKISERYKIRFISEILALYRIHGDNANTSVNMLYDSRLLLNLYMRKFKAESLGFKIKMTPKLIKKSLAILYYYFRSVR